jgi:hypothetical protein
MFLQTFTRLFNSSLIRATGQWYLVFMDTVPCHPLGLSVTSVLLQMIRFSLLPLGFIKLREFVFIIFLSHWLQLK